MSAFHQTKEWQRLRKVMRPRLQAQVDAGMGRCPDCGRAVLPGQVWQVGHIYPASQYPQLALEPSNLAPSHKACNNRAGAKLGAQVTNAKRHQTYREEMGLPDV